MYARTYRLGDNMAKRKKCPVCNYSHIVKVGYRMTKSGRKQRFQCMKCGSTFY